jgi:carbonic anhydrase/acetyltransferase-like protein (isoleucine patch superfamily)
VVGAPAKVRRELDKEAIDGLMKSALGYQKNAERFRKGLCAL